MYYIFYCPNCVWSYDVSPEGLEKAAKYAGVTILCPGCEAETKLCRTGLSLVQSGEPKNPRAVVVSVGPEVPPKHADLGLIIAVGRKRRLKEKL